MLVFQAGLTRFNTMADNSGRLQFDTQELTPDMFTEVGKVNGKHGVLLFKPGVDEISKEELEAVRDFDVNSLTEKVKSSKSKSQIVRALLYKNFEINNEGFDSFDQFYTHYMDALIVRLRKKLEKAKEDE
jgi:hypothetical protein